MVERDPMSTTFSLLSAEGPSVYMKPEPGVPAWRVDCKGPLQVLR
eukprot:CAMPEP_0174737288 /NCGR_PEP_ID=MMETSP1094-20130205/68081_1 /TAXON_ID=156173 /ORGANISM="Chrysochromulina brevifilum, Strain UTEX LB 985" /LENGTH=44 /DNA_ID= /DNA_START= /DNA_END= /DNA_ORIENTATION=